MWNTCNTRSASPVLDQQSDEPWVAGILGELERCVSLRVLRVDQNGALSQLAQKGPSGRPALGSRAATSCEDMQEPVSAPLSSSQDHSFCPEELDCRPPCCSTLGAPQQRDKTARVFPSVSVHRRAMLNEQANRPFLSVVASSRQRVSDADRRPSFQEEGDFALHVALCAQKVIEQGFLAVAPHPRLVLQVAESRVDSERVLSEDCREPGDRGEVLSFKLHFSYEEKELIPSSAQVARGKMQRPLVPPYPPTQKATKMLFRVGSPYFTGGCDPNQWAQVTSVKFARKISLVGLRRCMLPLLSTEVKAELVRLHPSQFYGLPAKDQLLVIGALDEKMLRTLTAFDWRRFDPKVTLALRNWMSMAKNMDALVSRFELSPDEETQFRLNLSQKDAYASIVFDEKTCAALFDGDCPRIARSLLHRDIKVPIRRELAEVLARYGRDKFGAIAVLAAAAGGDPNYESVDGQIPLCHAVRTGSETLVARLLDLGADPNRVPRNAVGPPRQFLSPLHIAIINGHYSIVELLLSRGVSVNQLISETTPLGIAAAVGSCELINRFLDLGAYLNVIHPSPDFEVFITPLEIAIQKQDRTAVELLLSRGANPNVYDQGRWTSPFLLAIGGADLSIAQTLLAYGADWRTCNPRRVSRLPLDRFTWFVECSGYAPNVPAPEGESLLELVLMQREAGAKVSLLLSRGALLG